MSESCRTCCWCCVNEIGTRGVCQIDPPAFVDPQAQFSWEQPPIYDLDRTRCSRREPLVEELLGAIVFVHYPDGRLEMPIYFDDNMAITARLKSAIPRGHSRTFRLVPVEEKR